VNPVLAEESSKSVPLCEKRKLRKEAMMINFKIRVIFISIALTVSCLLLIACKNDDSGDVSLPSVATNHVTRIGKKQEMNPNNIAFNMMYIPGGITFPKGQADASTSSVTNAYWIGETAVTYELWKSVYDWAIVNGYTIAYAGNKGSTPSATHSTQHPVSYLNWRDAIVWTNALTEYYNLNNGTSFTPAYYTDSTYQNPLKTSSNDASIDGSPGSYDNPYVKADATGFRLLTADEFELAARYISDDGDNALNKPGEYYPGRHASGADEQYDVTSDGSDLDKDGDIEYSTNVAVFDTSSTEEVKSKSPNKLGLYDMNGNMTSWIFDLFDSSRRKRGGSAYLSGVNEQWLGYFNNAQPYEPNYATGIRLGRSH
jgi:formylglycine-generating enzyme required for sulfatase activity